MNGVVADIPTRVGEFAVAGLSTTPLMTIADMSQINVEVNVDETEINNVKVGQEAKVKVDALGDKEIKAVVTQKNPLAISKSDTTGGLSNRVNVQEAKEFKVTLELKELPEDVTEFTASRHELDCYNHNRHQEQCACSAARIDRRKGANAGSVAGSLGCRQACRPLRRMVRSQKSQKGVYLIEGNKVRFIEVTTGITGEADIEITSGVQTRYGDRAWTQSRVEDAERRNRSSNVKRRNRGTQMETRAAR